MSPTQSSNSRNSVGKSNMAMYVLAVACIALGGWLAGYTKINLLTDQVSSPYEVVGYTLIAAGILIGLYTSSQAKKRIRK